MGSNKDMPKSFKDLQRYDYRYSPYVFSQIDTKQRPKYLNSGSKKLVDTGTGELVQMSMVGKQIQQYDNERFHKTYEYDVLNKLPSVYDHRVLLYIARSLGKNEFTVVIDRDECAEYIKSTKRQVQRSLIHLCYFDVIRYTNKPNYFHVNISVIFNGDRVMAIEKEKERYADNSIGEIEQTKAARFRRIRQPDGTIIEEFEDYENKKASS